MQQFTNSSKRSNSFNAGLSQSLSQYSLDTADPATRVRIEREFEQELLTHPKLNSDVVWPQLIAASTDVGPIFCLDSYQSKDEVIIALGGGNGDVTCSGWIKIESVSYHVKCVKEWNVIYRHKPEPGVQVRVTCLAFSPNGRWLASSSWDGRLMMYQIATGRVYRSERLVNDDLQEFPHITHNSCTTQVAWDPSSTHVVVGVSRVQKFQGQTHPMQIPGGIVVVRMPEGYVDDGGECSSELVNLMGSRQSNWPWQEVLYHWGQTDSHAVWCVSAAAKPNSPEYEYVFEGETLTPRRLSHSVAPWMIGAGCGNGVVKVYCAFEQGLLEVAALMGHRSITTNGGIWDVCFLPSDSDLWNGKNEEHRLRLASAGEDHQVIVWDVARQTMVSVLTQMSQGFGVTRIQYFIDEKPMWVTNAPSNHTELSFRAVSKDLQNFPNNDGITSSYLNTTYYHTQTNTNIPLKTSRKLMIISASWDNSLSMFDIESASVVTTYANVHSDAIFDVSVLLTHAPDGYSGVGKQSHDCSIVRCITISRDKTLKLWNYELGGCDSIVKVHTSDIVGITVVQDANDPTQQVAITASKDGKLKGINIFTTSTLSETSAPEKRGLCSLTPWPSQNGEIAYGDNGGEVHVHRPSWEPGCKDEEGVFSLGEKVYTFPHSSPKVAFLQHEVAAVCWIYHHCGEENPEEYLADSLSQASPTSSVSLPMMPARELADLEALESNENPSPSPNSPLSETSGIMRAGWPAKSPSLLVSACSCGRISFQHPYHKEPLCEWHMNIPQSSLCTMQVVPEGVMTGKMLSGGTDGKISMWDIPVQSLDKDALMNLGTTPAGELYGHTAAVVVLRLSADGNQCASGSWDFTVRIWHIPSRSNLRVLNSHSHSVTSVNLLPFSDEVLSSSWDQRLLVWDVGNSKVKKIILGHAHPIGAFAVTSDGKWLISGDTGGYLMTRPINSTSSSLLMAWGSFIRLAAKLQHDSLDAIKDRQLFQTFVSPPSTILHGTLFPYRITLLHYFAMVGDLNAIRLCFKSHGGIPLGMKRDCFNRLPIDWAIARNHMECVDELLFEASKFPWQMGEILGPSIPTICKRSIETGHRLRYLPIFLDSRFSAPLPYAGSEAFIPLNSMSQHRYIVRGSETASLTLAECSKFFKVPPNELAPIASTNKSNFRILYLPYFVDHVKDMHSVQGCSAGAMDNTTLQCEAWEALTTLLWKNMYQQVYFIQFLNYIGFCCLGIWYLWSLKRMEDPDSETPYSTKRGLSIILAVLNFFWLVGEFFQLRNEGGAIYFRSIWNWIQFTTYTLFLFVISVDVLQGTAYSKVLSPHLIVVGSLVSCTTVLNVLCYTRGLLGLAIVMRMLGALAWSLRHFMFILVILTLSYAAAVWMLLTSENEQAAAMDASSCDLQPWWGFGDVLVALAGVGLLQQWSGDIFVASMWPNVITGAILYGSYTFFVSIVMLNLLIAVMNNEYDAIQSVAMIEAKRERYYIMDNLESSRLFRFIRAVQRFHKNTQADFPRYLLLYSDYQDHEHANAIHLRERKVEAKSIKEDNSQREIQDLDLRIARLLVSNFDDLDVRFTNLEACVAALEKKALTSSPARSKALLRTHSNL